MVSFRRCWFGFWIALSQGGKSHRPVDTLPLTVPYKPMRGLKNASPRVGSLSVPGNAPLHADHILPSAPAPAA